MSFIQRMGLKLFLTCNFTSYFEMSFFFKELSIKKTIDLIHFFTFCRFSFSLFLVVLCCLVGTPFSVPKTASRAWTTIEPVDRSDLKYTSYSFSNSNTQKRRDVQLDQNLWSFFFFFFFQCLVQMKVKFDCSSRLPFKLPQHLTKSSRVHVYLVAIGILPNKNPDFETMF